MLLYILLLLIAVILAAICNNNNNKNRIAALIIFTVMGALCACRDLYCGTDTLNYYEIWRFDPDNPLREPLFILSMTSINDFRIFIIVYAILTYTLLYYAISKYSLLACFSALLFMISPNKFFPETFNIIRQCLAGALMLIAFLENTKKNKLWPILLILLASSLHYSSIIAIPFLFLKRNVFKQNVVVLLLILSFSIGIFGFSKFIINDLTGMSDFFSGEFFENLSTKYSNYSEEQNEVSITYCLTCLIPLNALSIATYPLNALQKKNCGYLYNIFFITTIMANIFMPAMDYGFRFVFSLSMVQLIVVPNCYYLANKIQRQYILISLAICILFYLHYLYNVPTSVIRGIVPYKAWA